MSEFIIIKVYSQPREVVWKALTDPALIPLWTSTGQGGRPEGFLPQVGTKFRFIGKPFPGWDGTVRCEVLEAQAPVVLRFTWRNKEGDAPSVVTNRLEDVPGGTRLTYEHTGFQGLEGFMMSRLLGNVRRKMLNHGLPAVLKTLDEHGTLRPKDLTVNGV
ncbi:SRPBCC family protein [Deinococcus ruber]|uniref:Activator of Hsp90 ATPase homologue 1/2-like C-terminal domain-containing protein n=1 Tax=Deinococcus ruber TaxID=1848197 RepID=A0A918FBS2_9DEIO|nr:SRPBCC domain-containing protein [Deinococcus ruber]GGR19944.1 hypothetical protein GCM10008957_35420 [Deinococcus ruber]